MMKNYIICHDSQNISKCSNVAQWSSNADPESCWWSMFSLIYRKLTFPHGRRPQFSSSSARSRLSLRAPTLLRQRCKSLTKDTGQPCELPDFNIGQQFEEFHLSFSLEPPLASGWWVDDRQVEANCGYSRAVDCRWKPRLRESPPLLRSPVLSCLSSLRLFDGDNRQTTELNGRSSYQKCPFSFFLFLP